MQNCRNNNPYMRRANCGCGNNNNSCNSNSCMANNDGRNPSMAVPVYRERSGCSDRDDALDGMPIAMAYVHGRAGDTYTKPEKDSTEEPYSKSLIFRLRGKEDVTHE